MKDLIKYVVPCLHKEWENFGYQLLNDNDAKKVITKGDVQRSARSLLEKWLGLGYDDTTWSKIIKCLMQVELIADADNIRKMLLPGILACLVYVCVCVHIKKAQTMVAIYHIAQIFDGGKV